MIQTFLGCICLIAVGMLGFGFGMAEEIREPTPEPQRSKWNEGMRSFCFAGMIVMMIAAGLLLGYK